LFRLENLRLLAASDFPAENPRRQASHSFYTGRYLQAKKKPPHILAHLVFAYAQANTEKPKELKFPLATFIIY